MGKGTTAGSLLLGVSILLFGIGAVEYTKAAPSPAVSGMISGGAGLAGAGTALIINDRGRDKDRENSDNIDLKKQIEALEKKLEEKEAENLSLKIEVASLQKEIEKVNEISQVRLQALQESKSLEINLEVLKSEKETFKRLPLPYNTGNIQNQPIRRTENISEENIER